MIERVPWWVAAIFLAFAFVIGLAIGGQRHVSTVACRPLPPVKEVAPVPAKEEVECAGGGCVTTDMGIMSLASSGTLTVPSDDSKLKAQVKELQSENRILRKMLK